MNIGVNKIRGSANFSTSSVGMGYYKDTVVRTEDLFSLINKLKEIYKDNVDLYDMDNVIKLRKMIMKHADFATLSFKDKIISLYGKNNKLDDMKLHNYIPIKEGNYRVKLIFRPY